MQVTTQKQPKNILEIKVELSTPEIEAFVKKAAVKISENTEIKGFRKGFAPYDVVRAKVGDMALYQEGAAMAIDDTLGKAMAEQNVTYVGQPEIRVEKLAPGNPFIYTATLVLIPDVELPDLNQITITGRKAQVTDAEVEKVITDLRDIRATEVLVDRPAKMGDLVNVDFDVFKAKVLIDGGSGKKYPLVLGKGQMIPGFEENLVGLKKDEPKEFQLKFPADYPNKNLAGQDCDFKVKVLEVFERTLPEFNDEFVKEFGDIKTTEDFKKLVKTNLEVDAQRRADSQNELEAMEKVAAAAKIGDIPDKLVQNETSKMIDELRSSVESRGGKFEDYLMSIKKKFEDLALDFAPESLRRVKFALIIRKVAEAEKITATPEEVDQEIAEYKSRFHGNGDIEKQVSQPGFKKYLENFVVNRKAVEFIKGKVIK